MSHIPCRALPGLLAALVLALLLGGCGLLPASPTPSPAVVEPTPTLLPPPRPLSSPEPVAEARPSPSPTVPPTRIPPPDLSPATPTTVATVGQRVRVVNTEGQGANLRAEPSPGGALVRTVREGTELEVVGDDRESGGRRWRNVRDPAGGETGWIVAELLEPVASAQAAPAQATPAPASSPAAASGAPAVASPAPVSAAPGPSPAPAAPSGASQRLGDADRAYIGSLQGPVEALGKAIAAANEQIERAGGRPDAVSDPTWRQDTQRVVQALNESAAAIRAAKPGPATGEVHSFAARAADRADEAAAGLTAALEARDARALNGVRTSLVRVLAEINNMNLTLIPLQ